ncbi:TcdA/TcdB pore-forming domain-containing protein [Pseudomonas sp.]|uniref:TcdA/TcdB pore-forming domain-containing protein n=1 Tax=Pseudomonas sp. TaxID=306 RepID=UPI003BB6EA85
MKTNGKVREIISAEDYAAMLKVVGEFAGTLEHTELFEHYKRATQATDYNQALVSTKLFKESLESLLKRKKQPYFTHVKQISSDLDKSAVRMSATAALLKDAGRPVPKIMHFVWVGGSEVGVNQRNYMNIWRQILEPQGYRFNLWYDSDALLAFEMNRVILDAARVGAMEAGGDKVSKASQLSHMIEERARVLKQQMFAYLEQPQWRGKADEARIDLMVRAYDKDRTTLEALRQRCQESHQAMTGADLQLRDVRQEFAGHFLQDVYQREVAMRGNFAAASDVVRLQAEYLEGGRYSDMDYLPPLAKTLGGVDISDFDGSARIGVLQLLLNHNEALMPGRDRLRYLDRTGKIPLEHQEALTAFAREQHSVSEIFVAPQQHAVPRDAMRLGTAFGTQAGNEMNAHILAHPGSGMTQAYMQMIRFNYDCLLEVERRARAAGIDAADERIAGIATNVLNERQAAGTLPELQTAVSQQNLINAIWTYYWDGIRPEARGTITLTGPGAASTGLDHYIGQHLLPDQALQIRERLKLTEGYNTFTEEELISGWTVNGEGSEWLVKELEKWTTGKLKSRYVGHLADLLKSQTLTFKQGWPVIEGKPVLLTSVLQQLMDDLGEPFIRAMKDKLSGDVTFPTAFSIDFDSREQIRTQPAAEIPPSVGAESTSNLNELFARVAHGSLAAEQLSPLVRVMLGGMFGATHLDAGGFAPVWDNVLNIARETSDAGLFARYHAIEKVLSERQSAVFESALARGRVNGTRTAGELKAVAMTEALTVKQWGDRIGQIHRTAQREYTTQIFQRSALVRDSFLKAGALFVRQMPQALLTLNTGDPGRRCYPLALLVGAAMAAGDSAERALVGHIGQTALAPQALESRALLSALGELQDVSGKAVGESRGLHNLDSVMQTLAAKTAPSVLLLDTGNHALLVAKVQMGEQTVYRFYDPNFALYTFAGHAEMQLGVAHYLNDSHHALARLYGLSDVATAPFNVIELDTAAIAERRLSSDLRVGSFLQSRDSGSQTSSVWARQALSRARSLNENARMGASLAQLDARYWAQELDEATRRIRAEHKLGTEYLPLLETVQATPQAGYSVTMVDARNPQNSRNVSTVDARLSRVKQHLHRLVKTFAGQPGATAEADGGSRLSFAFAIQALINEMRLREYQAAGGEIPALSIALQVQVYVSYAQLGFGVVSDTAQIINLVRQVAASEQALALRQSSLSGRLLSRGATAAGVGFSLVNIGFDVYGLSVADNHEQRSRLSAQLTFDIAALGLDIVALAVGGTVGAAAAILSVPLLGVGIGVSAVASNLGQIKDKATAVGNHLQAIHNAYQPGAYTLEHGVLQFPAEAVITRVDLHADEVRFDSQKFYPWKGSALELPQYDDDPKQLHRAIDIRQALELPGVISLGRADGRHTVVLPCTPICYFGYEYQLGGAGYDYVPSPGERVAPRIESEIAGPNWLSFNSLPQLIGEVFVSRSNTGIHTRYPQLRNAVADKLEYDRQGNRRVYLHSTPFFKHILYKLHPICKPTTISVRLDDQVRQLAVPDLPKQWHAKLSYEIAAPAGQYQMQLTPGLLAVNFQGPAQWVLRAPWVNSQRVVWGASAGVDARRLSVDGMVLEGFDGLLELADGELFQVDWPARRLRLVSLTLQDGKNTLHDVLAHLRKRAGEQRLAPGYVALHNFEVPYNPARLPVLTTAYYDTQQERLLYARNLPAEVNSGLVLGAATASHAWFYHPDHGTIWRVDAQTGSVVHRYRLLNLDLGTKITGFTQQADGSLHVTQQLREQVSVTRLETTLTFQITERNVTLLDIKMWSPGLEGSSLKPENGSRIAFLRHRLKKARPFADETPGMARGLSTWSYAPFVHAHAYSFDVLLERAWIGTDHDKYFRAQHGSTPDMVLLMPKVTDPQAALIFYSKDTQTLSHGIELRTDYFFNQVIANDIAEVTQTGDRYFATRTDGRLFEIDLSARDDNGLSEIDKRVLKFVGLGPRWLRQNPDWLSALPALAKTYKAQPFPLIGLAGASGDTLLAAWCLGEKVVLVRGSERKEFALLGQIADEQAVWLLDVAAGQILRQSLMPLDALREAFGGGSRLLHRDSLPRAQKVWSQWTFSQVAADGEGLLGRTRDGVNVQLRDHQPASIVSVEKAWSYIYGESPEELQVRLRALLHEQAHAAVLPIGSIADRYKYYVPALDRVFDIAGRADGQWSEFLGTFNETVPLLFDPVDGLIFSRGAMKDIWLSGSYAHREGEVLSLEVNDEVTDWLPLLPDGVDTLILTFGAQTTDYRISTQVWQRLDCIVIDPRRASDLEKAPAGLLILDLPEAGPLLMSRAAGHLVFSDPDSARSLIVRDTDPQDEQSQRALELRVTIDGKQHTFSIEQWLQAYSQAQGDEASVMLSRVINAMN